MSDQARPARHRAGELQNGSRIEDGEVYPLAPGEEAVPTEVHVVVRFDGRIFGVYSDDRQAYKDHRDVAGARIVPATLNESIRGGR